MRPTAGRLRARQGESAGRLRGMARRLLVTLAGATGLWQLLGFEDDEGNKEIFDGVEVFPGVGVYAVPKAGAEAIVLHIAADGSHPVIVATRDKSTQVQLERDETAIFNSQHWIKITKEGEVLICARDGGSPEALVKRSEFNAHTHALPAGLKAGSENVVSGGLGPSAGSVVAPAAVTGTTVLKAQ